MKKTMIIIATCVLGLSVVVSSCKSKKSEEKNGNQKRDAAES
jgi:preprotein translocase subunit SecG